MIIIIIIITIVIISSIMARQALLALHGVLGDGGAAIAGAEMYYIYIYLYDISIYK